MPTIRDEGVLMHRPIAVGLAVVFALIPASSAGAAPGDFPEQPRDLSTACAAVISHGQGATHHSGTADAIINALYADACLDG